MEAIILAGGLGTRLKGVIKDIPKPMAEIGDKPFLEYILKYLQKNDITRVIVSVGYKWQVIQDYFGDKFENIDIVYSIENELLGTGGAIKQAMGKVKSNKVYILNGDTYFDIKLKLLKLKEDSKLAISLKEMVNFERYGCVKIDDKQYVKSFIEKKYTKIGNINGGVYLARKSIFDDFILNDKFSFETFMQDYIQNLRMNAKVFTSYFIDIGIPEDYKRACIDLVKK